MDAEIAVGQSQKHGQKYVVKYQKLLYFPSATISEWIFSFA